jgi:hypothetical protein
MSVMSFGATRGTTLAYVDTLFVLGVVTAITVPLVFTTRKVKPGKAAMAH